MNLSRWIVILLAALIPAISKAEGFVTIDGKLRGGHEVIVDMETSSVWLWRRSRKGEITQVREFKGQGCEVIHDDRNLEKVRRILFCAPGGATPLAGTRYVGKPSLGDCWKGAPEFIYHCVEGCGPGSRAPRRLTQNHWECS